MTFQKSSRVRLVFTSSDGRAEIVIGSQVDFSYALPGGARSVVSLPLEALPTLDGLFTALMADEDVLALIPAPEPEPEPEEPPVEEPEVGP